MELIHRVFANTAAAVAHYRRLFVPPAPVSVQLSETAILAVTITKSSILLHLAVANRSRPHLQSTDLVAEKKRICLFSRAFPIIRDIRLFILTFDRVSH